MTAVVDARYGAVEGDLGTWYVVDTHRQITVGECADKREAAKTVQRMNALLAANAIRKARRVVKQEIRRPDSLTRGLEACAAILEDNPPAIAGMRVEKLLRSVPRLKQSRLLEFLRRAGCSTVKLVGDLTDRQRELLIDALRDRA